MQKSAERRLQAHLLASTHSRAFDKMAPFWVVWLGLGKGMIVLRICSLET